MPRRISPESSLETLKQEAKDWLRALRDDDAQARERFARALSKPPAHPTLREVQHALARELGFDGWAALKARTTANQRPAALAAYERMASHLLDAYRTGTPEAMERHWADTWHRRTWQTLRTYVQLDLGKRPTVEGGDVELTLDDARMWIARDAGFENWNALVRHAASLPVGRALLERAVHLIVVEDDGTLRRVGATRDFDEALELLRQGVANGIGAEGQLDDTMLARLADIENVVGMRLGGSRRLTSTGLRALRQMARLRLLDLSGSHVADDDLAILPDLPGLADLNLAWTPITDTGAAHLARCDKLERVDLGGTATGDGAIRVLAGKPRLHRFTSGARVTDEGIPFLHGFPVFKEWKDGLVKLELTSPDADPNHLELRGSFTDRGLVALVGLDGLFALNVDDASLAITPAGFGPLARLPRLTRLACEATDATMSYIAALPVLRFLAVQDTTAGDDGFVALSRSQSIEAIWGRRCHNLRRRGFQSLARMPALRSLSVSCKNVDDEGVAALPSFPALRELMPMDIPDEGYRHIGKCTELDRLILMYCRDTGDVATSHIVGLQKLRRYFASYTKITDRTPQLLSAMVALEEIELQACPGVTHVGIAALARAPRLRRLSLSGMQNATADAIRDFPPTVDVRFAV
jgi:hypothetical protein